MARTLCALCWMPDRQNRRGIMFPISSGHFSHDDQVRDAVSHMRIMWPELDTEFGGNFPEWDQLEWSGAWLDAEASGVDPEYTSWVTDWLEDNTPIMWEDGEPYDTADPDDDV